MSTPPADDYISARDFLRLARLPVSPRTLHRWCDDNPHLARRLGELRSVRRRMYDPRTAANFREHWIAAQADLRRDRDRDV